MDRGDWLFTFKVAVVGVIALVLYIAVTYLQQVR